MSGNKLISFLNEVELVICTGRQLVAEPVIDNSYEKLLNVA